MKKEKVTPKNFFEEAAKFNNYFNQCINKETAIRSKSCKAGRLEIYTAIFKGKFYATIYTHPVETAFESEVYYEKFEFMEDAVKALKKEEAKLIKMKSWWNH